MFVVRRLIALLSTLALVALTASDLWSQAAGLAARVPSDANTIVILDVDKIMASPIAQREKWREDHENAATEGMTILPPSASQFIMAAKLDLEFMQPIWEVALSRLKYEPSMPEVAAKWGGQIDNVAGRSAVLLPDDSYVVQLGPANVASRRPANRQSITRWLRETNTSGGRGLSQYIKKAIGYADKLGTPIVMALDLEGVVSAESMQQRLASFGSLKDKSVDISQLAKLLESVQGVTLGLNVKDRVSGAMIIDFAGDTSPLEGLAKPIILEVLANQSATIDEFSDWKAVVEPNRVRFSGQLNASGLQRVMSILDAPASLQEYAPSLGAGPDPEEAAKLASQQCFKSVTSLVEDLRKKPGKQTSGQVGTWWGRYADKIDKLPMLNVDEELLDYRYFVSSLLREGATTLRSVGGKSRVRQLNAPPQYQTVSRWGSAGFYGVRGGTATFESARLEQQNKVRIRTEERVQGAQSAGDIMVEIDNATAEIRRKMTEKYKAEF